MTLSAFLEAYRWQIQARWPDSHSVAIDSAINHAESLIRSTDGEPEHQEHGPAAQAAWHSIGGDGQVTLAKLRQLNGGDK